MRALDTNVLARFFVDDPDDSQARLGCDGGPMGVRS